MRTLILFSFSVIVLFVVFFVVNYLIKQKKYKQTDYYLQTKNSYLSVIFDKGRIGEFYIYKYLKSLDGYKKFLFNIYIPKSNEETTELDVVLLHESGLYVFESKNYSGWIFGSEAQKEWTQTLPTGNGRSQKNHFLDPIIQNKVHLKWLKNYLADNEGLAYYSYIIFSDRCTLKDIRLTSGEHFVINRYNILPAVQANAAKVGKTLSPEQIDELYNKLYPLTQVNEAIKIAHIEDVKQKQQSSNVSAVNVSPDITGKICPSCGSVLVLRTVSKGARQGQQFWGCSKYPHCRYTENVPCSVGVKDQNQA